MLAPILLATILPASALAGVERDISRYEWQCRVSLPLAQGTLIATRTLKDDGISLATSDFANWSPKETSHYPPHNVNWYEPFNAPPLRLHAIKAMLKVFVTTQQDIPRISEFRIYFGKENGSASLGVILDRGDSKNNKHIASAEIPLSAMTDGASSEANLEWRANKIKTSSSLNAPKLFGWGWLPLAPLREAAAAQARTEAELDRMAASWTTSCERKAIPYDPASDI